MEQFREVQPLAFLLSLAQGLHALEKVCCQNVTYDLGNLGQGQRSAYPQADTNKLYIYIYIYINRRRSKIYCVIVCWCLMKISFTGTPEVGGLTSSQGLEIVRGCKGLNIVGGDLVEVSGILYSFLLESMRSKICLILLAFKILLSNLLCHGTVIYIVHNYILIIIV